jgi:hypothetical protein
MTANNEFERMWKDTIMACCKQMQSQAKIQIKDLLNMNRIVNHLTGTFSYLSTVQVVGMHVFQQEMHVSNMRRQILTQPTMPNAFSSYVEVHISQNYI